MRGAENGSCLGRWNGLRQPWLNRSTTFLLNWQNGRRIMEMIYGQNAPPLGLLHGPHAVAFAAIRTTKTREHFAESSYTTQLRVQTMHNTRIVLPVAPTIARAEICLGCWRDRPFLNRTHLVFRRGYSDGKAVGNTTGLRRRLHPPWRISLLQSLCRALGQTEASSNF